MVLALLLSYLLRPIVRGLARIKIPTLLGAALILITLLSAITLGISALATPAAGWLAKAPDGLRELETSPSNEAIDGRSGEGER